MFQNMQQTSQIPQTPENIFKGKVGELAYSYMRASYPTLVPFIITLKIDNIDLQNGNALGIFAVKCGKEVLYIPVVVGGGSIISCEMVYNKNNNTFYPLINKEIHRIVKSNEMVESGLIKSPRFNTTFNMFRSMLRPPISERMGYASTDIEEGIKQLPNLYKEALYKSITSSKELLAKVSSYYSIEDLHKMLQPTQSMFSKEASEKSVITIDDLDYNANKYITKEAAEKILDRGYGFIKKDKYKNFIYKKDDVNKLMSVAYKFQETTKLCDEAAFAGNVVVYNKSGNLEIKKHCIIDTGRVLSNDNTFYLTGMTDSLVMSGGKRPVTAKDLECCGACRLEDFVQQANVPSEGRDDAVISVWIPTKNNTYKCIYHDTLGRNATFYNIEEDNMQGVVIELTCSASLESSKDTVTFISNPALRTTTINLDKKNHLHKPLKPMPRIDRFYIPEDAYFLISIRDESYHPVDKLTSVVNSIITPALNINIKSDNHEYTIKDNNIVKTMQKEADLADYLYSNYDVHPDQVIETIETVKNNPYTSNTFLVLEKQAASFDLSTGNPQGMIQQNVAQQTGNPQYTAFKPNSGAPNLAGRGLPPVIDSDIIDVYAMGFNKSLLDIGILASLYNNEDIKGYLLDFTPQFIDTISELGKTILLFSINKKTLEDSYGVGEYYNIISVMRKIFKSLAEVVVDLKTYLSNNSVGRDVTNTRKSHLDLSKNLAGNSISNNI